MKKQFEDSLCSIPQFFHLILNTIKSSYIVLFLIFCMVFLCAFYIVKPLNSALDYCIENNIIDKLSNNINSMKNKNTESLKTATKILDTYANISDLDMDALNDYLNSHQINGQFDESSLKSLLNSNINSGLISSEDLNKLLQSDLNKATNKKTTQKVDNTKDEPIKEQPTKNKFKLSVFIIPFVAIIFCSMFSIMIGYVVRCYIDDSYININEMIQNSFRNFFQTSLFYIATISTFTLLLFVLETFIKGNMMFFNVIFAFLTVVIVVVIVLFLLTCARFVFIMPLIGLFEFNFLKALTESLDITKRLTINTMLRSFFCTLLCLTTYIVSYLLFNKTNSSFLFGLIFTLLVMFSSLYHSFVGLNISCLLNPEQYNFDDIVNDYSFYEPEKAESLWSNDLDIDALYEQEYEYNNINYEDLTKSKSIYVNLSILKNDIDCVNKDQSSNKFIY